MLEARRRFSLEIGNLFCLYPMTHKPTMARSIARPRSRTSPRGRRRPSPRRRRSRRSKGKWRRTDDEEAHTWPPKGETVIQLRKDDEYSFRSTSFLAAMDARQVDNNTKLTRSEQGSEPTCAIKSVLNFIENHYELKNKVDVKEYHEFTKEDAIRTWGTSHPKDIFAGIMRDNNPIGEYVYQISEARERTLKISSTQSKSAKGFLVVQNSKTATAHSVAIVKTDNEFIFIIRGQLQLLDPYSQIKCS